MRMKFAQIAGAILAVALGVYLAPRAQAQNPDTMMPEQSAAKGKQILRDLINGLGVVELAERVDHDGDAVN